MTTAIGDSIRRRRGAGAERPPGGPRPPVHWLRLMLLGILGAAAAFGVAYALAVLVLFPAPAAAAPGIMVPSLAGEDTLQAKRTLAARGLRLGTVTPLPDPAAAVGQVVAQNALAGQQLRRGGVVSVAVSAGAARAVLPDVSGYAASRATALLSALGFQVTQQVVPDSVPAGRVIGLSPAPDSSYELPAPAVLTVSAGPPPDTTARADSSAAMPVDSAGVSAPARQSSPVASPTPFVTSPTPPVASPKPPVASPKPPVTSPTPAAPITSPTPDTSRHGVPLSAAGHTPWQREA